jgi:hypothetical protein
VALWMVGWLLVAFLLAVGAHAAVPDDGETEVDVTMIFGTAFALALAITATILMKEPLFAPRPAAFGAAIAGAWFGVWLSSQGMRLGLGTVPAVRDLESRARRPRE